MHLCIFSYCAITALEVGFTQPRWSKSASKRLFKKSNHLSVFRDLLGDLQMTSGDSSSLGHPNPHPLLQDANEAAFAACV